MSKSRPWLWSVLIITALRSIAPAPAEQLAQITGLGVRLEQGRLVLEVDHEGPLPAKIVFTRLPSGGWRAILPKVRLDEPMDTTRAGKLLARLIPLAQGVALEIQTNTPPVGLGLQAGALRFDLSAPVYAQTPATQTVARTITPPQPNLTPLPSTAKALIPRRLELDPVAYDSASLLASDTPTTTPADLPQALPTPAPFNATPLERVALSTQSVESGQILKEGEFLTSQTFRLFTPSANTDDIEQSPSNTYRYGVAEGVELTLDLQGQDNNGPGAAGSFVAQRPGANTVQEFTLQTKFRLVDDPGFKAGLALSGTYGTRTFTFSPVTDLSVGSRIEYGRTVIPALELPMTWVLGPDTSFTLNPKVALPPQDNIGFLAINPQVGGSFTTIGAVGLGLTQRINERLLFRADATPILFGSNSYDLKTGLPTQTLVYNAGLRYLVNPRVALDLFVTNAYGNTGIGALAGRNNTPGVGLMLTTIPDRFLIFDMNANKKFDKTFDTSVPANLRRPFIMAGFGFLDGGTIPEGKTFIQLKGGSNGVLASYRSGSFNDLETGFFVNFTASSVDESEAGFSTKIRFLNQAAGDPVTLSGLITLGRTSENFLNYLRADRNASRNHEDPFNAGIGDRGPLPANLFGLNTERLGEILIITLSAPIIRVDDTFNWWLTPKFSFVQRAAQIGSDEVVLAGVSVGGAYHVSPFLDLIGEVSPLFRGKNILVGNQREQVLPWNVGLRYTLDTPEFPRATSLDLYVTNSLGLSPYQSLRAQADNGISFGFGVNFPLQLPF